jgi:2-haloacid dehalogenase
MNNPAFSGIAACVFDAYGTLFDVHSAVARHNDEMGNVGDRVSQLWRTKQLEYTWLRSLMGQHADFWQVTGEALDYALDAFDIGDKVLRNSLMDAYLTLSPYPEVRDALSQLKQRGVRLAILSNGAPNMLDAAVAGAGIKDLLDEVLSVEDVGIYKPSPRVYQLAVERLQVSPEQISFQSSNAWDAVGAAAFGFKVAWINRFAQHPEQLPAQPQAEIRDLTELLELLD